MKKVLSIIVPTYNMENYLHLCLESLILDDQVLFEKTEVLIVNDGSKDKSIVIAKEFEKTYPEVFRVIDKPNGNYGSCVNRGLREAQGKYIKVLDADDMFYTNAYKDYISFLCEANADMILTGFSRVNSQYRILSKKMFNLPVSKEFTMKDINSQSLIEMHSVTYRTQMLREIGYKQDEGISYTDAEWCFIPLMHINSVRYCPVMLYCYLIGREGQTIDPQIRVKSLWMMKKVFERLISFYFQNINDLGDSKEIMHTRLLNMACYIYRLSIPVSYGDFGKSTIEFDLYIKQISLSLYKELASVVLDKYVPVMFINDWRNNPSKRKCYWNLYNMLIKCKMFYHKLK